MPECKLMTTEQKKLVELIPQYYEHKQELDTIDKTCKAENADIKKLMEKCKVSDITVDDLTAKYIIKKRETFNEEKLIQVLKNYGYESLIKTREYVDMDALEDKLYHNAIATETIMEMDKCKNVKETIELRVTKKGGTKDE